MNDGHDLESKEHDKNLSAMMDGTNGRLIFPWFFQDLKSRPKPGGHQDSLAEAQRCGVCRCVVLVIKEPEANQTMATYTSSREASCSLQNSLPSTLLINSHSKHVPLAINETLACNCTLNAHKGAV